MGGLPAVAPSDTEGIVAVAFLLFFFVMVACDAATEALGNAGVSPGACAVVDEDAARFAELVRSLEARLVLLVLLMFEVEGGAMEALLLCSVRGFSEPAANTHGCKLANTYRTGDSGTAQDSCMIEIQRISSQGVTERSQ